MSSSSNTHPALALQGVAKTYPGVVAVAEATFTCRRGEIHALLGENGAGKSTLMGIATGTVAPDRGEVVIAGQTLERPHPRSARAHGIAMVYQDDSLLPDLTVAENLLLASAVRPRSWRALNAWAGERLTALGFDVDPRAAVRDLPVSARGLVEIAKALESDPAVVVLDEPTAALGAADVERLHARLRALAETGVAIVYITHRLNEVFAVCDRATVMRDGRVVASDLELTARSEDELVTLMAGRSLEATFPPKAQERAPEPLLRVRNITADAFSGVSFDAHAGEVVGFAGIDGNGQREVLRALGGLERFDGEVTVGDAHVRSGNVAQVRSIGISYTSAERKTEALFTNLGVRENMTFGELGSLARFGIVSRRREVEAISPHVERLALRTPTLEQPTGALSGGNQQKVALGRALLEEPRVHVVDEPTQGVDVATRAQIYRLLRSAAADGATVLVLSSDAVELAGFCDRVLVFARGHLVEELEGDDVTEERIVGAAVRADVHRREQETAPEAGRARRLWNSARDSDLTPVALMLLTLVVLGIAVGSAQPIFLTSSNIGDLLFLAVPFAFAALAQTAVMMIGGIDLSVGPLMSLTTVALSQLMIDGGGGGRDAMAIAAALGIGLAVGALNGALVCGFNIVPLVATLATFIFVQGIALLWLPDPGGFISFGVTDALSARIGFLPWAFAAVAALALLAELVYRRRRTGLWFRAVGSRPAAARRSGAPSKLVHFLAYMSAGLLGAVAGLFFSVTIGLGDARIALSFTLASVTAAVLGGLSTWGGRGSFVGPVLGAVVLAFIANASAFLNLESHVQYFLHGGLLVGAIGLYSRMRRRGGEDEVATA
jgi:ribose transport system ATP-binding protein